MTKTSHALILIIVTVYVLCTMVLWLSPIAVRIDPMARIMTIGFFGVCVLVVTLSFYLLKGPEHPFSFSDLYDSNISKRKRRGS